MRRLLSAALVAGSLTFVGFAPAQAVTAPTVDSMDWTTTPGHVVGTVTSDQPWVFVSVGSHGSWPGDKDFFAVDPDSHQASFDLETWGMIEESGPSTQLGIDPCTTNTFAACTGNGDQPLTVSDVFQPTDVRPDITFSPADGNVGSGPLTATVSDPNGGGILRATWVPDRSSGARPVTTLDRTSSAAQPVSIGPDGGTVSVQRCTGVVSNVSQYYCDDFDPAVSFHVNDQTAPHVTTMTVSRPYVRPEAADATNSVSLYASGSNASLTDWWEVVDGNGDVVRSILDGWVDVDSEWDATFDGRDDDGLMLPAGPYTIRLRDAAGNVSATTVQVQVQHLVSKTFTKTVTAKASKVDQYVGRCSKLASPSSQGWAGSLGYFANTRCRSTTGVDSTVATEHSIGLPAATSYRDVQISAYGGAAKGFGRSVAVMYYEDPSRRNQVAKTILGAKVGTWAGPRKAASTMVKTIGSARYVFWTAGTAARQHYDVKGFTVTVRYQIWQ